MENSDLVNAGYGSNLTLNGKIECDSGLLHVNKQKWTAMSCLQSI